MIKSEIEAKIEEAKEGAEAYLAKHAWYAMREYDAANGTKSNIGNRRLVYRRGGHQSGTPESKTMVDVVGNAYEITSYVRNVIDELKPTDNVVKPLAEIRLRFLMDYTIYEERNPAPQQEFTYPTSHRNMLSRLVFDKFVEKLGGRALVEEVLRKVAKIIPDDHSFIQGKGR